MADRVTESPFSLPVRSPSSHKGSHGSVLAIGANHGMCGAVILASRAALYCGAGKVYAVSVVDALPSYDASSPELMIYSNHHLPRLMQQAKPVLICGCGLGQTDASHATLDMVVQTDLPLVLDADALNCISSSPRDWQEKLLKRTAPTVMTPHPGEAARLLSTTVPMVQSDRLASARCLSQQYQSTVVLKGHESWVVNGLEAWKNTTGNPGLASAGTGDVLAGILGALIAQGLCAYEAARLATYVHGRAADQLFAKGIGLIGMTASEVMIEARNVLNQLRAETT